MSYGPGVLLCAVISAGALAFQRLEEAALGHPYVEALVLAILIGTAVRTVWAPGERWRPGIAVSAKFLLELAVTLLGASVSLGLLASTGIELILGIAGTVVAVIAASFLIGRALGLPGRMAALIAVGNSVCGNSAIAAVAPVIGATGSEIASSIAFTAVLGVLVVLTLPLLVPLLGYTETQYGIVAGMTVYAVPQVLAATAPVGATAVQVGTLVKLVRVLMLGPVVLLSALAAPRLSDRSVSRAEAARPGLGRLVPWFIVGFLLLAAMRSLGAIPAALAGPAAIASQWLTIVSMAALGLGVDLKVLGRVGPAVVAAVTGSLLILLGISLALVRGLGVS